MNSLSLKLNEGHDISLQLPQHVRSAMQPPVAGYESPIMRFLAAAKSALKWFTEVDTGTPSLGLSSSEATAPIERKPGVMFDDEGDWFVDQTFVHADEPPLVEFEAPSIHESINYSLLSTSGSTSSGYHPPLAYFSRRTAYYVRNFFSPRFKDPHVEEAYVKEVYYGLKRWAAWGTAYLMINWALYLGLNLPSTKHSLYAQIVYYGGLTAFTLPLPVMVGFNMYIRWPVFFQIWLICATWWCGITEIIQVKQCHFYTETPNQCFGKDFLAMMYYITAVPALMMFTMSKRFYNCIMQVICVVLIASLILPDQGIYARNLVSFVIFSVFVQGLHHNKEQIERRVFALRRTMTQMYKKVERAKRNESSADKAKSRFASYIFHEVRVPLNVAQLSFDYIEFAKGFDTANADIKTEINALATNLSFMQKVLNDALDFNRLDEGTFPIHPKPFPFHYTIKAILRDLNVAAFDKGLKIQLHLDPEIDGEQSLRNSLSAETWADADDIRLRQIITNLTSNAIKFTPPHGGDIHISTKLVGFHPVNSNRDLECDLLDPRECDHFVVRVEVSDNGPGISPEELRRNHLFEPFEQAAAGHKAGKGSGLGLAIIKQIVKRSHGSLGLKSRQGMGATFWFELPLKLASEKQVKVSLQENAYPSIDIEEETISEYSREKWKQLPNVSTNRSILHPDSIPVFPGIHRQESLTRLRTSYPGDESTTAFEYSTTVNTPQPLEPPGILPPEQLEVDEKPISVLVVDDEPMTRTIIAKHFRTFGCTVDVAEDGHEFVEKAALKTFDLITLDNTMPRSTGEESIKRFRDMGRNDYVVGCTGNAIETDRDTFMKAGLNQLFTKPLGRPTLHQLFNDAVKRRQHHPNHRETPPASKDTRMEDDVKIIL